MRVTLPDGDTVTWWGILLFCIPAVLGKVLAVWFAADLMKTLNGPEGGHPRRDTIEAALQRFELRRDAVSTLFALIIYFSVGLSVTVSLGGWSSVEGYMRAHFMDGFGYVLFFTLGWRQVERHTDQALQLFGLATAAVAAGAAFAAGADWFYILLVALAGWGYGLFMWINMAQVTGPAANDARRLLEELHGGQTATTGTTASAEFPLESGQPAAESSPGTVITVPGHSLTKNRQANGASPPTAGRARPAFRVSCRSWLVRLRSRNPLSKFHDRPL